MALEVWLYSAEGVDGARVTVGIRDASEMPLGSQTVDDVLLRQFLRKHGPKVYRHGRLASEQRLDLLFDRKVAVVDLVVEGDHFVGKLDVLMLEGAEGSAQGS